MFRELFFDRWQTVLVVLVVAGTIYCLINHLGPFWPQP
jgi:hypothetical protein